MTVVVLLPVFGFGFGFVFGFLTATDEVSGAGQRTALAMAPKPFEVASRWICLHCFSVVAARARSAYSSSSLLTTDLCFDSASLRYTESRGIRSSSAPLNAASGSPPS